MNALARKHPDIVRLHLAAQRIDQLEVTAGGIGKKPDGRRVPPPRQYAASSSDSRIGGRRQDFRRARLCVCDDAREPLMRADDAVRSARDELLQIVDGSERRARVCRIRPDRRQRHEPAIHHDRGAAKCGRCLSALPRAL